MSYFRYFPEIRKKSCVGGCLRAHIHPLPRAADRKMCLTTANPPTTFNPFKFKSSPTFDTGFISNIQLKIRTPPLKCPYVTRFKNTIP